MVGKPLRSIGAIIAVAAATSSILHAQTSVDAIYYDGSILTGQSLSSVPERVTALAIHDGVIVAIGSDDTVLKLKSAHTQVVDLKGAFVMPGFNDAHAHLASAGAQKLSVDLDGVHSLDEMKARIQAAATKLPAGAWLRGAGWDQTKWANQALPTARNIDTVSGGHPAFLERTDGHIAVANTVALKHFNSTRVAPTAGGKLDHENDAPGAPLTGILRDTAMESAESHLPVPTMKQRELALSLALQDAVSHGVTSLQDNSYWEDFLAFESLEREGKLPVRITEWLAFSDPLDTLKQHRSAHRADDRMLHTGMLKGFLDGSLGSRTAALNAPYADDAKNSGLARYQQTQLNTMTAERMGAGFQIGFHAIGDHAVEMALDAFTFGEKEHPDAKSLRPRIEHSQVLDAQDFDRYKQLG